MSAKDKQVGGGHYKDMPIQPVTFITANKLGFLEGCVIKRMCRWQSKDGLKDLRKAIHEIELLIEAEFEAPSEALRSAEVAEPELPEEHDYPERACTCRGTFPPSGAPQTCHCPPVPRGPEGVNGGRGIVGPDRPLDAVNRAPEPSSRMGLPPQFRDGDDNRETHKAYGDAVKLLHELGFRYIRAGDYGHWSHRGELVPAGEPV